MQPKYDPVMNGCSCQYCPLQGSVVVPPCGPPDADMVIVAESPGYWETKKGQPLVGPSGVQFNDILYFANGIPRGRLWLTNTILCRPMVPGADVSPKKKYDMKTYLAWIRTENMRRRKAAKATKVPPELMASPLDCCAPRLWGELGYFEAKAQKMGRPNGAVVIALGNFALKQITGREGVAKYRGSPLRVDFNDPQRPVGEGLKIEAGGAK